MAPSQAYRQAGLANDGRDSGRDSRSLANLQVQWRPHAAGPCAGARPRRAAGEGCGWPGAGSDSVWVLVRHSYRRGAVTVRWEGVTVRLVRLAGAWQQKRIGLSGRHGRMQSCKLHCNAQAYVSLQSGRAGRKARYETEIHVQSREPERRRLRYASAATRRFNNLRIIISIMIMPVICGGPP